MRELTRVVRPGGADPDHGRWRAALRERQLRRHASCGAVRGRRAGGPTRRSRRDQRLRRVPPASLRARDACRGPGARRLRRRTAQRTCARTRSCCGRPAERGMPTSAILIVNADDFGLSPGDQRRDRAGPRAGHRDEREPDGALARGARGGRVHAREPPGLGVGLHVDLGRVGATATAGGDRLRGRAARRAATRSRREVAAPARVAFRRLMGARPDASRLPPARPHCAARRRTSFTRLAARARRAAARPHDGDRATAATSTARARRRARATRRSRPAALIEIVARLARASPSSAAIPGVGRRQRSVYDARARDRGGDALRPRACARRSSARASSCARSPTSARRS